MVALEDRPARHADNTNTRIAPLVAARCLLPALVVGFGAAAAQADTFVVGPGESIQAVINDPATVDGDVIIVLPGVYNELVNFNGKAITLQSEDPADWATVEATILDGGMMGTVVTCAAGEGAGTVLAGLTITGGSSTSGGGMYCFSSSPTIRNCAFLGNTAMFEGGAIMMDFQSSPTLLNCRFLGNEAIYGGAISSINSTPSITNCMFAGNNSVFSGSGGAIDNLSMSDALITNCVFFGNTAGSGGAVANTSSTPVLSNCIMWGDSASSSGAEIANFGATPLVAFSNVAGSGGSDAWDASLGVDGGGNLDADPLFSDAAGADGVVGTMDDDLSLASDSPCVDAGNSGFLPLDSSDVDGDGDISELLPLDLAGNERIVDATNAGEASVDMGAFERAAEPQPQELVLEMDIRPLSCRNRVNRCSRGRVPVGLLGTADFDISLVDAGTISLMRADGVGGEVEPWNGRWFCRGPWYFDFDSPQGESNGCGWPQKDGHTDMLLKFRIPAMVEHLQLNDVARGQTLDLILRGRLIDGTPFTAHDSIRVVAPRHRRHYTLRRCRR